MYESATNRLDKIVKSFDPETGQVHKDEQGKLKIQVVVDWPFTAGFQYDEEYKGFFKWAKHLNNYHPNITDKTLGHKKYHPLRYQTKPYDERMSRLSIFSQEECQFLQDYHRLRQSPERFKPKELFFVMGSNHAQEEAESKLHSFEIEKDTICRKRHNTLYRCQYITGTDSLSKTVASAVSSDKNEHQNCFVI